MRAPGRDRDDRDLRFDAIYRKRYARVWRFFRARGVSDDESHELAQDTFIRFHRYMDDLRNPEQEWPFLQTIARTTVLNWWRYWKVRGRYAKNIEIDAADESFDLPAPQGLDYAEREEQERHRTALYSAISELPESQRQCLLLWLQDFKYDEIAGTLRITVDAAKSRLRDAKKHLRTRLGGDVTLPEDTQ